MARRKILIGNWKMFKTVSEATAFANAVRESELADVIDYAVCPPFTALYAIEKALPAQVKLGAQNLHFAAEGAFTGEISASMLVELGVTFAIIGHSERRHVFNESDEWVRQKTRAAVKVGLTPVLCVGEDLRQRELDHTVRVVERQTRSGFAELTPEQVGQSIVAYEPVWAIGSGLTPTAEDAESVIRTIRETIAKDKGDTAAANVRILYGGSVKPDNIAAFTAQPNIDGALVGGASLDPGSFVKMAKAMAEGVS